jgi:hypothetical protein
MPLEQFKSSIHLGTVNVRVFRARQFQERRYIQGRPRRLDDADKNTTPRSKPHAFGDKLLDERSALESAQPRIPLSCD